MLPMAFLIPKIVLEFLRQKTFVEYIAEEHLRIEKKFLKSNSSQKLKTVFLVQQREDGFNKFSSLVAPLSYLSVWKK